MTSSSPMASLSSPPQFASGLSEIDELRATDPSRQGSLSQVQSSALRELDALSNKFLILGVQFPFLQQQIEGLLSMAGEAKVTLIETLAPQIQAESQSSMSGTGAISGGGASSSPSLANSSLSSPPSGGGY